MHGLVGSDGIIPIDETLKKLTVQFGQHAWHYKPTLFWLDSSDSFLNVVAYSGLIAAVLAFVGILAGPALLICWITYLSICNIGGDFFSFQWDTMLLECGLLSMFLLPWTMFDPVASQKQLKYNPAALFLFRWLLFRVMFFSGVAKFTNESDCWRNFSAPTHYYETQLLPNVVAWYAHKMPLWLHVASVPLVFVLEIVMPFLYFAAKKPRVAAGVLTMLLQLAMLLTGNHGFINLLTAALCLSLFDDQTLAAMVPTQLKGKLADCFSCATSNCGLNSTSFYLSPQGKSIIAFVIVLTSLVSYQHLRNVPQLPQIVQSKISDLIYGYHLTGNYGLYPKVLSERTEIVVEGSNDLVSWQPYQFKFHIDSPSDAPPLVSPYQPRLDWRMRFAALTQAGYTKWFHNFVQRLLKGSTDVVALLKTNPFPNHPPKYIRADVYQYTFTTQAEKNSSGDWWKRKLVARYIDPVSISESAQEAASGCNVVAFNSLNADHRLIPLFDGKRRTNFSGNWYARSKTDLTQQLKELELKAEQTSGRLFSKNAADTKNISDPVLCIIAPHAAYRYSGITAARAYLALRSQYVERVFLIGPIHQRTPKLAIHGAILPESLTFTTPLGELKVDQDALERLGGCSLFSKNELAHRREHSIEMQLPMIRQYLNKPRIVPILVGKLNSIEDAKTIANAIRQLMKDGDAVIISADFSHYGLMYGFAPEVHDLKAFACKQDREIYSLVENRDSTGLWKLQQSSKNYICGFPALLVLINLLPKEAHANCLDYFNSQDAGAGDSKQEKERYVGYVAASFSGCKWNVEKTQTKEAAHKLSKQTP